MRKAANILAALLNKRKTDEDEVFQFSKNTHSLSANRIKYTQWLIEYEQPSAHVQAYVLSL